MNNQELASYAANATWLAEDYQRESSVAFAAGDFESATYAAEMAEEAAFAAYAAALKLKGEASSTGMRRPRKL